MDEYDKDQCTVNLYYDHIFSDPYLRPEIRLEIGPLAEWTPSHLKDVRPFAAESYPLVFEHPATAVRTVDAERTFWEKILILHKIANFPEDKVLPQRYSRHLYDVYCMGHSPVRQSAFERKDLLSRDVSFNMKFYYSRGAGYETAALGSIDLIPQDRTMDELRRDYAAMGNMIYGEVPSFDTIIDYLRSLQDEVNGLQDIV